MSNLKISRAWTLAVSQGVHNGAETRKHILNDIAEFAPSKALAGMTSKQIAALIVVASKSYHAGRASCQASVEADCVWIGAGVEQLIPLAALKNLQKTETVDVQKIEHASTDPYPLGGVRCAQTEKQISQAEYVSRQWTKQPSQYYTTRSSSSTTWSLNYTERH